MKNSRQVLKRRVFLGALGLGVSAPLALRMSRFAVADPGPRPRRLLIVFIPHGVPAEHFTPVWDGTTLTLTPSASAGFTPVGILEPLMPYNNYVNVLYGVSMNAGATNHAAVRATLTGFPEGVGSDSIDTLIAKALNVKPLVLGPLGYDAQFGFNENCHLVKQGGTWVVPEIDPAKTADALFGPAGGTTAVVDESAFRSQVLDLTQAEVDALQKTLAGLTREQNKLQIHLEAIQSLKAGSSLKPSCTGRPPLPAVDAARGLNVQDDRNFTKVLDAHLELVGAAFACGAANVITLQNMFVNAQYTMDFAGGPGITDRYHDPSSHSSDFAGRAKFATIQRWFYNRLSMLVAKLATTMDGADTTAPNRTLLDNTIIMTCSEISDGFFHNSQEQKNAIQLSNGMMKTYNMSLPMVLIGGGSGYLKTGGQIVQAERPHTDVLATLSDAMGVPMSTMGGQNVSVITDLKAAP